MLAKIWVDQGNSERPVLLELGRLPVVGEPLTNDAMTGIGEKVDLVENAEHQVVVRLRLTDRI